MKQNIYDMVTQRILEQLDAGVVPWRKPWVETILARSHRSGEPYSALNQMLLLGKGGEWATFKQIQDEGGHVKKGAKACPIVFWTVVKKDELDENGREVVRPILRWYNVFHLGDVEGVETKHINTQRFPNILNPIENAEKVWRDYCRREGITILNDSFRDRAFYSTDDRIELPNIAQFAEISKYYSTVFHECVHSTGHKSRLKRDMTGKEGTKKYAQEELVAEIGAAMLCSLLGLTTDESLNNSAAYIKLWRDRIADDNKLIVVAAGRAQKAVEYILGTEYYNALQGLAEAAEATA